MGIAIGVLLLLLLAALAAWRMSEFKREAAERELERTLQLFDVSLEVNSTIRKQDLLLKIMETTSRIMNAEASSVILLDAAKEELFFDLALGEKGDEVREIRLKLGEGIAGWVAQTGQSVKIDDAAQDERWSSKVAKRVDYPTRNMLCVPLVSKGAIIGVLQVLNKRDGIHFSERDLLLLESIASPTAVSLENAMLYDALEQSMDALKTTTAAKERMESELRIASDIQMGFLPRGSLVVRGRDMGEGASDATVAANAEAYVGAENGSSRPLSESWEESPAFPIEGMGLEASGSSSPLSESWEESPAFSIEGVGEEASVEEGDTMRVAAAEVQAVIRPAREVGGDFYDYFRIGEDRLFFALGDVSDKGIPAALFMAVTMTLLKGKMTLEMTPGELLTAVNQELYKEESTMFATIFCGVLHVRTGQLLYSDGGHCTPYIVRETGAVEPLKGKKGLPLGVMDDMVYLDNEADLAPGDRIVLYTDGITEAEDRDQRQYGSSRLQELLAGGLESPRANLLERLIEDVDHFTDKAAQSDDIAVLTVYRQAFKM
ncbi:SpoIIE family protein phosphatase [Paenibacillus sp. SI8]|uniref:SpoIIE family protein phosphatase n=1 Tax=unclassified Paenibacillus TaxID=185978 RepID=UPI0034661622